MAWKSSFQQNYRTTFSPTVPPSAARISRFVTTWRHLVAKVGTSKRGGKQWQTTPKNLPRMQHTRAIPVAWLSSGLCPDRPKGWIPIIIIMSVSYFSGCRSCIVQAVSHWPFTRQAQFRSKASSCGFCSGQSDAGTGFSLRTLLLQCHYQCHGCVSDTQCSLCQLLCSCTTRSWHDFTSYEGAH